MNTYHIFSMGTLNMFKFIKTLATNLKQYKKEDSKYIYHIFLLTDELDSWKQKLSYLISDDFELDIQSFKQYQSIIKSTNESMHWATFFKCLVCQLFPNLDKILYLDIDIVLLSKGLQEFMDTDLTNYYVNACTDVVPTYNNKKEVQNCKTTTYFNAGVIMFNLKKIRQDGLDKRMYDAVTGKWPYNKVQPAYHDQSLLNYLFREHVLLSNPKFNNNILPTLQSDLEAFKDFYKKWGYNDLISACSNAVILHWAGVKPWDEKLFPQYFQYMIFSYLSIFVYNYFIKQD